MCFEVDTKDTVAVKGVVEGVFTTIFPDADKSFVAEFFGWALDCFKGRYKDYQEIDARYHDLEHTMQGTLCMVKLLQGRHQAEEKPRLTQELFKLGLLAILFHDTGYLKKQKDTEGTGAKYTLTHVKRSKQFAALFLSERNLQPHEIKAIQNMISCTGVGVDLDSIPFHNPLERIVGYSLGTADLVGQMAAKDYIDKLPILYTEFEESLKYSKDKSTSAVIFDSAEDLMQKTPGFWEHYVLPKINNDFFGLYKLLAEPPVDGHNPYIEKIEANMNQLKKILAKKGNHSKP